MRPVVFALACLLLALLTPIMNARSDTVDPIDIVIGTQCVIHSGVLDEDRTLSIYLPYGYEESNDRYPVLYLLDGHVTARLMLAASTMELLDADGKMPQMIIVGIDAPDAARDYFPFALESRPASGRAENFLKFIADELIPFVDSSFRTHPYRVLCGFSNSGLFTLYATLTRPDIFQGSIAASPTVGWSTDFVLAMADTAFRSSSFPARRLYMNYATDDLERLVTEAVPELVTFLNAKAPANLAWTMEKLEGAGHVPYLSIHNGLSFVFGGWRFPTERLTELGLAGVKAHYSRLTEQYGFPVKIPSAILFDLGRQYLRDSSYVDAIPVFQEYVEAYPRSVRGHYLLGESLLQNGDSNQALEYFKKALEIEPTFAPAKRRLESLASGN
ncbi:MAG: alpha/beta hydrolase-fold protein [Anaerolineales bacterium]|jgi:hypothetical protein